MKGRSVVGRDLIVGTVVGALTVGLMWLGYGDGLGMNADGVEHTFEFRSMLVPTGHALYARERVPEGQEGYEFSVLGDFDANVWNLFRVLYERVQQGLAGRHVERGRTKEKA